MFGVAVLIRQGSNGGEHDVDPSGVSDDAVDVDVDGAVIERVDRGCVCAMTGLSDALSDGFHVRPGSPSQKDLRAFSRKLARDGGPDRAPRAEYHGTLPLQYLGITHGFLRRALGWRRFCSSQQGR